MKRILLVGGGERAYREYGLRAMAGRYAIYLLSTHPPEWELMYLAGHLPYDAATADGMVAAARSWHEEVGFSGVLTYSELLVEPAARIAAALGLSGNTVEAARRCRDKHAMRAALAASGVASARSHAAATLGEAVQAAATIGYPVVVKPPSFGGSIGVTLARDRMELQRAFAVALSSSCPGAPAQDQVLVEEYLDGPEVSVESAVVDGAVHCVAVTEKALGFDPYFEEVGHLIAPDEPLPETARILDVVRHAHRALDIRHGITHSELRLTRRGPAIVEVGARLGGDLIPYLAQLATGVDMTLAAADLACGETPDLIPTRAVAAAIRFLYPPTDGRFASLRHDTLLSDGQEGLDRIETTARHGDLVQLPPNDFGARVGFVIVTGQTRADCVRRLDRFEKCIVVEMAEPSDSVVVMAG